MLAETIGKFNTPNNTELQGHPTEPGFKRRGHVGYYWLHAGDAKIVVESFL
jgi:hypothetical protein